MPGSDVRLPLAIVQDHEIRLQGTAMHTRKDMEPAMRIIAEGKVDVSSLVTKTVPLADNSEGFRAADSGGEIKINL